MPNWRAGYAQRDITPGPGHTLLAGFGTERYARGTIAPLRAQALALSDRSRGGGATAVLISADVLGFDRVFLETIRRALGRRHDLPPESILLAPSHTHCGPAFGYRVTFDVGAPDLWYRHGLERALLELADEALADLKPATLAYTALEARIGHCRRAPGGKSPQPNPAGDYDQHTPVLTIERRDGELSRILLVTHACHPTSSGRVAKWSPDYPGALRDRVESALDRAAGRAGSTRVIFAMGGGGTANVCHRDPATGEWAFSRSPALARRAGHKLAGAILDHLGSATPTPIPGPLSCHLATGWLTFASHRTRRQLEAMAYDSKIDDRAGDHALLDTSWARQMLAYPDTRRRCRYEALSWRFGDALTLLALEGEVCSPLAPLARSLATTPHAMLLAYANATEGYIPSATIVREGGYEGESSHRAYFLPAPFTPRVEREFTSIVRRAASGRRLAR